MKMLCILAVLCCFFDISATYLIGKAVGEALNGVGNTIGAVSSDIDAALISSIHPSYGFTSPRYIPSVPYAQLYPNPISARYYSQPVIYQPFSYPVTSYPPAPAYSFATYPGQYPPGYPYPYPYYPYPYQLPGPSSPPSTTQPPPTTLSTEQGAEASASFSLNT